jgi:hypothetical protein
VGPPGGRDRGELGNAHVSAVGSLRDLLEVLDQPCLADARFAADDHQSRLAQTGPLQPCQQRLHLIGAADEHRTNQGAAHGASLPLDEPRGASSSRSTI